MRKYILVFTISLLAISCFRSGSEERPLARVYDKYLYADEIRNLIPPGTSPKDSANKVNNYIDIWMKKQLMIKAAEDNLPDELKDFDKKIEDYRASLLMYTYRQKFIEQKLDTVITNKDLEDYYTTHETEFRLTSNSIKGIYIKVMKIVPEASRIRALYRTTSANDSVQLAGIAKKSATKFTNFGNDWVFFKDIIKELPITITDQKEFLSTKTYIEVQDSLFYYFVNIKSYKLKGDLAPLTFVKDNVKSIILNKRKVMMIEELEKNIYQNALNHDNLQFFNEK